MTQPLVAVTSDVKEMTGYRWHAVIEQYLRAVHEGSNVLPVIVPSFGTYIDLDALLEKVDGVLVTGSRSNVYPEIYGGEASEKNGPYDRDRDATTLPLIRKALDSGTPLLAICRGIQELNVALGGTLETEIQELDGIWDHRSPEGDDNDQRFGIRQKVHVKPGSCIASILGDGDISVNSLHRQAIGRLAAPLVPEAFAPDGTIEAVSVANSKAFAVGVQWHPEYWFKTDTPSRKIFEAFGKAVHAHANGENPARQAAE